MRQITYILIFYFILTGAAAADEIVIIMNPAVPIDMVTARDLHDIYFGYKRTLPGGTPVTPFAQKDRKLTTDFCEKALGTTLQQYFLHWRRSIFTGQGSPPAEIVDDEAMKQIVADNPKAIGYIDRNAVDASVKVMIIRGLPAED